MRISDWSSDVCSSDLATKILWGQVLVVFTIVLASVWSATPWTAAALGHQHKLGSTWFTAFDVPVYLPPDFFWWWFSFAAYIPDIFPRGAYRSAIRRWSCRGRMGQYGLLWMVGVSITT